MRLPTTRAAASVTVSAVIGTVIVAGCSTANNPVKGGPPPARSVALDSTLSDPPLPRSVQPLRQQQNGAAQTVEVAARRYCSAVRRPFRPRSAAARGVARNARVLALHESADGSPGVPPLTAEGKQEFAWDRDQGIRPGDRHGHVLFNAHTWPDGSALGNRLLANLHVGDRIVVRGRWPSQHLCYRVVERVTVPAQKPMRRYYRRDGRPRLAIVACSGRRLGPGEWTSRTVWFAKPIV